jgi:hypothetical protein
MATAIKVVMHMAAEALPANSEAGSSYLADTSHVSAETSRRQTRTAALAMPRHAADSRLLDLGHRPPRHLPRPHRALDPRDNRCRVPGCGKNPCNTHHVEHWADGGPTRLANTAPCRPPPSRRAQEGFTMAL